MKQHPQAPEWSKREFDVALDESPKAKSSSGTAEDYALVIGVNHYPSLRPLRGAIADAQAFTNWLVNPKGGNVSKLNLEVVLSSPDPLCPIGPEIDVALENILERAERVGGRRFYFYFSGHGAVGDRASDLALCMADWSNRRRRAALSSDAWLDVVVRSGIFEEVAYFFDCCRVWATRAVGMPPRVDFVTPSVRDTGTRVFVAYATEFQRPAIEVDYGSQGPASECRGIFTRVLIDVLQRHAASSQKISAAFLKKCIEEETEKKAREIGLYQRAEVLNGYADTSGFGSARGGAEAFSNEVGSKPWSKELERLRYVRNATSAWEEAYAEFRLEFQGNFRRPAVEQSPAMSRLQVVVFPRESRQSRASWAGDSKWTICTPFLTEHQYQHDALPFAPREKWQFSRVDSIQLEATAFKNSTNDNGFFFSGNLATGAYIIRHDGPAAREMAVRLFRGWTTLVVIDAGAEPHFENARVFLTPLTRSPDLPRLESIAAVALLLAMLNSDSHIPHFQAFVGKTNTVFNNPMHALAIAHLLAASEKPDLQRIEAIANQVKDMIGPCADVDALLLRAALIRGGELPRIKTSTPPMLRAGLLAFIEASHKKPELIPPWSWLEHACIERLVDSPITSWPARTASPDKNAILEDSIDDFITQSIDELATTDAETIARELGVPTLAVTTRMTLTRNRTTRPSDRRTSAPPPPSSENDEGPTRLMSPPPPSSSKTSIPKPRRSNLPPPGNSLFPSIPGYEIESLIGKGGMGEVYMAKRIVNGDLVAIKIIQENAGISVKGRRRFLREIDTLVVLQHPRIVALLDHGYANGYFYFTMPYYPLGNVADQVKRLGRRSFDQATRIILDVLEGLAYAHQLGFVHRDIKPQNILVDNKGRFFLADFGLAKEVEKPHPVDANDMPLSWAITTRRPGDFHNPRWMGTPEFMPPEQVLNFRGVRPSADVWAVAKVYYWLLCGILPKSSALFRRADMHSEPRNGWPSGLVNLLEMAMQDNPEGRPPNAGAFRRLLEEVIKLASASTK